jgi:uncharacterized coiled-coil protein SlyX
VSERLDEVEFKLAYTERRVEELDDVVRSLSETVDILVGEVARLRQLSEPGVLPPGNVKPPHY